MICGGVATRRGDFWCTIMVERCLDAMEEPEMFAGEKAATVGGFGSYEGCGVDEPFSGVNVDFEDMEASQGVSNENITVSTDCD